jgi:hypothetical protein
MGEPFSRDDYKEGLAAPRTGFAEQGEAIDVRHGKVGYDHIEVPCIQQVERFPACGEGLNNKPRLLLENEPEDVQDGWVIVDHENGYGIGLRQGKSSSTYVSFYSFTVIKII